MSHWQCVSRSFPITRITTLIAQDAPILHQLGLIGPFCCPWFCDHGGFLLTNHALLDDGYMAWLKFELCHVRGKITFFLGQNMALVLSAIYVTVESQNCLLETRFYLESSSLFLLFLLLLLLVAIMIVIVIILVSLLSTGPSVLAAVTQCL